MPPSPRLAARAHERRRVDGVPALAQPFGSDKVNGSVKEALQSYLSAETLSGDNQYQCSGCDRRVDATKGLAFTKLPYILTLQLKRFDFDYVTMQRKKLNDEVRAPPVVAPPLHTYTPTHTPAGLGSQVKFPFYLDMNDYMGETSGAGAAAEEGAAAADSAGAQGVCAGSSDKGEDSGSEITGASRAGAREEKEGLSPSPPAPLERERVRECGRSGEWRTGLPLTRRGSRHRSARRCAQKRGAASATTRRAQRARGREGSSRSPRTAACLRRRWRTRIRRS